MYVNLSHKNITNIDVFVICFFKQKAYCPQGHLFLFVSYKKLCSAALHSPYRYGTRCDICSVPLLTEGIFGAVYGDEEEVSGGIYHCDICKFDLCSNCLNLIASFCQECRSCGKKNSIVRITCDDIEIGSFTCNKCKKAIKTGFGLRCEECGTVMCSECFRATAVCSVS